MATKHQPSINYTYIPAMNPTKAALKSPPFFLNKASACSLLISHSSVITTMSCGNMLIGLFDSNSGKKIIKITFIMHGMS